MTSLESIFKEKVSLSNQNVILPKETSEGGMTMAERVAAYRKSRGEKPTFGLLKLSSRPQCISQIQMKYRNRNS